LPAVGVGRRVGAGLPQRAGAAEVDAPAGSETMNRRLLPALAATAALTGCGWGGVYSLPLPGAEANGAHTYTVNVQLADVLDLVPYSAVKVNDATVGHVSSIKVQGSHALVACR